MENQLAWVHEFPAAVTVCDRQGIILSMNQKAADTFAKYGGSALLGQNALDCHPEPSRTKLLQLLESGSSNVYTIEKDGIKKMIYQSPWYQQGVYAGFVEISLPIPFEVPHFIRK